MTDPVLALMGPTASGKSALAEALAQRFDAELISVDSALVYRGLSIGAAKPDYPHHLVHVRDPMDPYTAADFARDAKHCMDEIRGRGRQPILVGGSLLYFRALIEGLDDVPLSTHRCEQTLRPKRRSEVGQRSTNNSQRWTRSLPSAFTPITASESAAHWRCIEVPVSRSAIGSRVCLCGVQMSTSALPFAPRNAASCMGESRLALMRCLTQGC